MFVGLAATAQQAAHASFSNESVSCDGINLIYKVSYTGTYAHLHVFYDTDSNASTGYPVSGTSTAVGADYMIEDTTLYRSTTNGAWGWNSLSATVTKTTPAAGTVQYSIPLSAIG